MLFVFILNILLLGTVYAFSFFNVHKGKISKPDNIVCACIMIIFLIMSLIAHNGNTLVYRFHFEAFFTAGAVAWGASLLLCKKNTALANIFYKALLLSLALEVLIFNFNAFQLTFKDYDYTQLNLSDAVSTNFDKSSSKSTGGQTILEFKNINKRIGTLEVNAESSLNKKMLINIDYADTTNKEYRTSIASAQITNGCKKSFTIPINASGEISKLRLRFTPEQKDVITINAVSLNTPIAFRFSLTRIFTIIILALLKYILCDSKEFSKPLAQNERLCKMCGRAITLIMIITAFAMIIFQRNGGLSNIVDDFKTTGGNQISQEIVDAFSNGQLNLLREVEPEIAALDNPYDKSAREGLTYAWDHLYFNGKYYSYYGIASVLILFLPYHLITGFYFPSQWAVFLFGAIGIFFLYKLYMAYMKEFFANTSINLILTGLVMAQLITGIWFCFPTPNFYEIAQTSGFAFCTSGFFCLMKSGVIGKGKIKNVYLALSAVLLSMAVLARPTLAVYCICALIFIFAGFVKTRNLLPTEEKNKIYRYIGFFASALAPYAVLGLVQMIYNYARFGSITDFGIEYSLTINDFINAEYHPHLAGIGFYDYLIAFPSFKDTFPFVYGNAETFNPNGYYFVATKTAIGLLWMAAPLFSYIYAKKAYIISENKNKRMYAVLLFATCIAAPFAIIASIWESGYGVRYKVDFAWQLLIGALTIAFIIYNHSKNEGVKKILTKIFFVSLITCFVFNFAQLYDYTVSAPTFNHSALDNVFTLFERAFEFWR